MTRREGTPGWYVEGNVAASVRNARQSDVPKSSIIWGLEDAAFDDIPKSRIKAIVESIPDGEADVNDISLPLSQDPSIQAKPREQDARIASVRDIQYLSPPEAARIVGLALEQFDGNTVRPGANESSECDLYWNRQHMTVGLRLVPVTASTVKEQHILALNDGETTVDNIRNPSKLAVVTNGKFTEKAKTVAADHSIYCFDGGHLKAWLRRAKITREALGTVLEDGENHDGPLDELVAPSGIPSTVAPDPLDIERAVEEESIPDRPGTDNEVLNTAEESTMSDENITPSNSKSKIEETAKPRGETGTLYADSDEDGDYDAFDRFVDDLKHGDSSADPSSHDEATSSSDDDSMETDGDVEDVSRKELLFDLIDTKTEAGEPIKRRDIKKYSSYSVSQYESEFESITSALDAANIKYDGDSL